MQPIPSREQQIAIDLITKIAKRICIREMNLDKRSNEHKIDR